MGTRQVFNDYYDSFGPAGASAAATGAAAAASTAAGDGRPYVSDETRIAVDLFDAKSHTPIWHATVSQKRGRSDRRTPEAKIGAGTAAIFSKFPIAAPRRRARGEDLIASSSARNEYLQFDRSRGAVSVGHRKSRTSQA